MMALAFGFSLVGLAGPALQWAAANKSAVQTDPSDPFWHAEPLTLSLPACTCLCLVKQEHKLAICKERWHT